ncbi:MAG: holo-[acyl-carrier protein] synthase [Thermodesulfobacteriota bacterium]|nr:holo-[acyl-carrier protein] synthase [Thermodesulfobacteriota bacterium]
MISGIGVDLVEIERLGKILERWGDKFAQKVFADEEISYCRKHVLPAMHFAARFAAKEACLKAFGIGLGMGVGLKDIRASRSDRGAPLLIFTDKARMEMEKQTITVAHLSLTHTRRHAMAMVVLEK